MSLDVSALADDHSLVEALGKAPLPPPRSMKLCCKTAYQIERKVLMLPVRNPHGEIETSHRDLKMHKNCNCAIQHRG
jgi:hypothetical protein